MQWIETGHGVLEDGPDLAASNTAHLVIAVCVDTLTRQVNFAAGYPPRLGD